MLNKQNQKPLTITIILVSILISFSTQNNCIYATSISAQVSSQGNIETVTGGSTDFLLKATDTCAYEKQTCCTSNDLKIVKAYWDQEISKIKTVLKQNSDNFRIIMKNSSVVFVNSIVANLMTHKDYKDPVHYCNKNIVALQPFLENTDLFSDNLIAVYNKESKRCWDYYFNTIQRGLLCGMCYYKFARDNPINAADPTSTNLSFHYDMCNLFVPSCLNLIQLNDNANKLAIMIAKLSYCYFFKHDADTSHPTLSTKIEDKMATLNPKTTSSTDAQDDLNLKSCQEQAKCNNLCNSIIQFNDWGKQKTLVGNTEIFKFVADKLVSSFVSVIDQRPLQIQTSIYWDFYQKQSQGVTSAIFVDMNNLSSTTLLTQRVLQRHFKLDDKKDGLGLRIGQDDKNIVSRQHHDLKQNKQKVMNVKELKEYQKVFNQGDTQELSAMLQIKIEHKKQVKLKEQEQKEQRKLELTKLWKGRLLTTALTLQQITKMNINFGSDITNFIQLDLVASASNLSVFDYNACCKMRAWQAHLGKWAILGLILVEFILVK